MRDEPKRWMGASSDAPAAMRELLVGGRQQQGTPAEVQALRERLIQVLPGEAGLAWPPATRAPVAAPRPTWLAWVAGGVGTAAVAWLLLRPTPDPVSSSPIASSPIASGPIASGPVAPSPPIAIAPPASDSSTPAASSAEPADLPPRTAPGAAKAPGSASHASRGPDEAELLRSAQAALAERPAQTLALTAEHERRFERGALREEREVLAIEALRRLGRNAAAAERAARFERRYPRSLHLEKIRGPK